jgi:hypothetical protein
VSIPISSTEEILKALKEHPDWRRQVLQELLSGSGDVVRRLLREEPALKDELRREILTEELLRLPARFEAAQNTILELIHESEEARRRDSHAIWEAIGRLTERMDRLTERFEAAEEARVRDSQAVWEAIGRLTERFEAAEGARVRDSQAIWEAIRGLTQGVSQLSERVGKVEGDSLELMVGMNPDKFLWEIAEEIRRMKHEDLKKILQAASQVISPQDMQSVMQLDCCFGGKRGGKSVFLAVEVSSTLFEEDVEKAANRSVILATALRQSPRLSRIPVIPVVVGRSIKREAEEAARRKNVSVILKQG